MSLTIGHPHPVRPVSPFPRRRHTQMSYNPNHINPPLMEGTRTCRTCQRELPVTCFQLGSAYRGGRRWQCTECRHVASRIYYKTRAESPERRKQRRLRTNANRKSRLAHYNISLATYDRLLAAQAGCCAICRTPPKVGQNLHVDHNHQNGTVRGLLCRQCNHARGWYEAVSCSPDWRQVADNYLSLPRHSRP